MRRLNAERRRSDEVAQRLLASIIARIGWPGCCGAAADRDAFVLACHCRERAILQRCVAAAREAMATGAIDPFRCAFLQDRLRLRQGRPQRYGTHIVKNAVGVWTLARPVHWEGLNERRRAIGLCSLAEQIAKQEHFVATASAARARRRRGRRSRLRA